MATITVKWSEFSNAGDMQYGDETVGLRSGVNYRFDFPGLGVKDSAGAYMMQWASSGISSVNYLKLVNAASGNAATLTADGETNVSIEIVPKGVGTVNIPAVVNDVTQLNVDNIRIDGNTISAVDTDGNITLIPDGTGEVDIFEPPASEAGGINVNGAIFNTALRVNDIGGTAPAQFIIHRHSTALQPILLSARSNSDTDSHAAVTNSMSLFSIYSCGWTASHYDIFASIDFSVDTTGTVSATSSPGRMSFNVTADGANVPTTAAYITNDKAFHFSGAIDAGLTNGQLLIGSTGANAVKATLTAGTGTSISNGAGSVTISSSSSSILAWNTVGAGGATMAVRNGYIANAGTLVSLALPSTFNVGDTISIINIGAGFFRITQGAGQLIRFGTSVTTTGAGGYLEATALGDSLTLVGVVANTTFAVLGGPQGTFTVV